jgi:hypothetical protein
VRGDRGEKAGEIRAVDRAPAVGPHHHGQGVLLGKRVQRRRMINVKARRAERGFGRDLVRSRLPFGAPSIGYICREVLLVRRGSLFDRIPFRIDL